MKTNPKRQRAADHKRKARKTKAANIKRSSGPKETIVYSRPCPSKSNPLYCTPEQLSFQKQNKSKKLADIKSASTPPTNT
jgi:hypothetical protein